MKNQFIILSLCLVILVGCGKKAVAMPEKSVEETNIVSETSEEPSIPLPQSNDIYIEDDDIAEDIGMLPPDDLSDVDSIFNYAFHQLSTANSIMMNMHVDVFEHSESEYKQTHEITKDYTVHSNAHIESTRDASHLTMSIEADAFGIGYEKELDMYYDYPTYRVYQYDDTRDIWSYTDMHRVEGIGFNWNNPMIQFDENIEHYHDLKITNETLDDITLSAKIDNHDISGFGTELVAHLTRDKEATWDISILLDKETKQIKEVRYSLPNIVINNINYNQCIIMYEIDEINALDEVVIPPIVMNSAVEIS